MHPEWGQQHHNSETYCSWFDTDVSLWMGSILSSDLHSLASSSNNCFFSNSGKCIVLHRWRFFSTKPLVLELTSVLPIFMVLQSSHLYNICRCSYCISSPEVLKLGVLLSQTCCRKQICKDCITVNSDSSDCTLPVLITCSVLCLSLLIPSNSPLKS